MLGDRSNAKARRIQSSGLFYYLDAPPLPTGAPVVGGLNGAAKTGDATKRDTKAITISLVMIASTQA